MSGSVCAKLLLCGGNGGAAVKALMDICLDKENDGTLSAEDNAPAVKFMEYVEDEGNRLARKIGGLPALTTK